MRRAAAADDAADVARGDGEEEEAGSAAALAEERRRRSKDDGWAVGCGAIGALKMTGLLCVAKLDDDDRGGSTREDEGVAGDGVEAGTDSRDKLRKADGEGSGDGESGCGLSDESSERYHSNGRRRGDQSEVLTAMAGEDEGAGTGRPRWCCW